MACSFSRHDPSWDFYLCGRLKNAVYKTNPRTLEVMAAVQYFWHGFIHRDTTFSYLQSSRPPLFIFCQMFGRRRALSACPPLLMFRINRLIARQVHLLYCTGVLAVVLSVWRRDRNHMDSYRVSTVDVPESPITSGARGPWQQACDSLYCHEEWWGSVPPSVVVFSWVHAITISSPKWKNHCEVPGTTQEINLSVL